jgi:hypothetical protein
MFTWSLLGVTDAFFKGIYRTVGTILKPINEDAALILFDAAVMIDFQPCERCDSRFECSACGCLYDADQRLAEAEAEIDAWEPRTEAEWLGNDESSCSGVEIPPTPPLQESPEGVAVSADSAPSGSPTPDQVRSVVRRELYKFAVGLPESLPGNYTVLREYIDRYFNARETHA